MPVFVYTTIAVGCSGDSTVTVNNAIDVSTTIVVLLLLLLCICIYHISYMYVYTVLLL